MSSRGTDWQILKDYQYRRIDSFLDPSLDPLGAGYHINQSMIALGSGVVGARIHGRNPGAAELPARETH